MPTYGGIYSFTNSWSNGSFTTPSTSAGSFTLRRGDTLVVIAAVTDYVPPSDTALPIISDNQNLSWTQEVLFLNANYVPIVVWSYTANAGTSGLVVTLSYAAPTSTVHNYGGVAYVWSDASGIGAKATMFDPANTAASVTLNCQQSNSSILTYVFDWNATALSSRTWSTINGITPTSANTLETEYVQDSNYTVIGAHYEGVGTFGNKTVSLTDTSSHKYTMVALEILGTSTITPVVPPPTTVPNINGILSISNVVSNTF